jgi:hypothetical protein
MAGSSPAGSSAPPAETARGDSRQLGVLLACFAGRTTAVEVHRAFDSEVRSNGGVPLRTTIVDVDEQHKARTYDPRRVLVGSFVAILVWGACGLLTGGWSGAILWGVLGGIAGYLYIRAKVHLATRAQVANLGSRLPPDSSLLLTWAAIRDSDSLLKAALAHAPSVTSIATISGDLVAEAVHVRGKPEVASAEALVDATSPSSTAPTTLVNMILTRYPDPASAATVSDRLQARMQTEMKDVNKQHAEAKNEGHEAAKAFEAAVADAEAGSAEPEVELVISTDRDGSRHVTDPNLGTWAVARAEVAGWAVFSAACGAIAGLIGNGFWGAVEDAVIAGVLGGILGFGAGALYGHLVGRAVSEGRLKHIRPLLIPGTSMIVAWAGGALGPEGLATLRAPGSEQLVIRFDAADGGMVLAVAGHEEDEP